jgi:mRNA interferase YafQ
MYNLVYTSRFNKDIKTIQKRNYEIALLKTVIIELEQKGNLPKIYKPHKLSGNYSGYWEAHIKPDWLIIWKILPKENEVWLTRTGTHADLF